MWYVRYEQVVDNIKIKWKLSTHRNTHSQQKEVERERERNIEQKKRNAIWTNDICKRSAGLERCKYTLQMKRRDALCGMPFSVVSCVHVASSDALVNQSCKYGMIENDRSQRRLRLYCLPASRRLCGDNEINPSFIQLHFSCARTKHTFYFSSLFSVLSLYAEFLHSPSTRRLDWISSSAWIFLGNVSE